MPTTVFISSTSRDLLEHRAAVARALLNAGYHPVDMANFMARPEGATSACLKEVAESDLFVGIYAWRYGYIPPNSEVSITEQEFIEAEKLGKPCFIFMVDENHPWPEEHKEGGIGARLLRDFKARLESKLVRTTFTTPEDLATKVLASLQRWERENAKKGAGGSTPAAQPASAPQTTGGINISGISGGGSVNLGNVATGNVTGEMTGGDETGGDKTGGDKIGGDKVGRDKIVGSVVGGSQEQSMAELQAALARWQKEIEARVEAAPALDEDEKENIKKSAAKVAEEAQKGPEANPGKLERWLNTMAIMAPDILDVTAATLQNPFKGVGLVLEKISDRVKLERQKQTS